MSMSNSSWTFFCPSAHRKQNKTKQNSFFQWWQSLDSTGEKPSPSLLHRHSRDDGEHIQKKTWDQFQQTQLTRSPTPSQRRVHGGPLVARPRGVTSKWCSAVTEQLPDIRASPLLPGELTARGRGTLPCHPAGRSYSCPHVYSKTKAS